MWIDTEVTRWLCWWTLGELLVVTGQIVIVSCLLGLAWMLNAPCWTSSEEITYRSMARLLCWMLLSNREKRKGRRSGGGGESRSKMVRNVKRQRDGDGEIEELRGHCLFYSYRPLAPSVGSNPEQRGMQSSPNSTVTKQEDTGRDEEVRHRWRVTEWKCEAIHFACPRFSGATRVLLLSSCPYLT